MTASGTKRLLDAINRVFQVVNDFDNCVFTRKRNMSNAKFDSGFHATSNQGQFQAGRMPTSERFPFNMLWLTPKGHKIADCWFSK